MQSPGSAPQSRWWRKAAPPGRGPAPKRVDLFLDDDDLTRQRFDDALNSQRTAAVRQGDVGHAGLLPRCSQRQRRTDDVENAAGVTKRSFDRGAREKGLAP